jgi:hypothetical protein
MKGKRFLISIAGLIVLFAITGCPGLVIDNITISFGPGGAIVGATGTFSCLSPISGEVITFRWLFGDGNSSEGQTVSYSYNSSGDFLVECHIITSDSVLIFRTELQIAPDVLLNIEGTGSGIVAGGNGINCEITSSSTSGTCVEGTGNGFELTLTATAAANFVFDSWTGCSNPSGSTCTHTMSGDETITANFLELFTLTITFENVVGMESVTSDLGGINCSLTGIFSGVHPGAGVCIVEFVEGTDVMLTASDNDNAFIEWEDCSSSMSLAISVAMNSDRTCRAKYIV